MKKLIGNFGCVLIVAISLFILGCGFDSRSPGHVAAAGGAGGAALGAGAGALVGTLLNNGDAGASALLGLAIGAPVGAAIGYYHTTYKNAQELAEYDEIIEGNKEQILLTEAELEQSRRNAVDGSFVVKPDPNYREDLYHGPSLGNPKR